MLDKIKSSFRTSVLPYWRALLVCPALFIYIYSNDINIISLNGLLYRKICLDRFNETICNSLKNHSKISNQVQEETSERMIVLNVAFLLPAILAITHMASVGDRRLNYKLPLVVSLIGSLAQALVNIFAAGQSYDVCFGLLVLSQFLNGILGGGSLAFISSCFSHIAIYESHIDSDKEELLDDVDNTTSLNTDGNEQQKSGRNRSIRYSICESFLLLGQFLGSLSSGYLIGNKREVEKFVHVYILSFGLYFFVLVYILGLFWYLKRGSQPSQSAPTEITYKRFDLKAQFNFVFETWSLLRKWRENNARFQINMLLVLFFLGSSISMGIMSSTQYLYLLRKPVEMSQVGYGIFKAMNTLFRAISLLVVLPVLKSVLSLPDYVLFFIGLTSELLNLAAFVFASVNKNFIWIAPIVYMFSNYYVVCIRSYGSRLVAKDEIGKYFAVIAVVEFLVLLTSSSLFQFIYKATLATFPQLVFMIGLGVCAFVCYPILIFMVRDLKKIK